MNGRRLVRSQDDSLSRGHVCSKIISVSVGELGGHHDGVQHRAISRQAGPRRAFHRGRNLGLRGFRGGTLVKTGERSYCIVGEWTSLQKLIEARPKMIGILDTFRDDLEDLGAGLGQTDPVSGEVVLKLPGVPKPRRKKPRAKPRGRK
jgi:hypothetical protein